MRFTALGTAIHAFGIQKDRFCRQKSGSALRLRRYLRTAVMALAGVLVLSISSVPAVASESVDTLLGLLGSMEASYARVADYSAVFRKQERVREVLQNEESVILKFRKPFQVYMKWLEGPSKEALYLDGQHGNKVVAHCDGVGAGLTWSLDPKGSILMKDNRHPITDVGFGFIIDVMRKNIPLAIKHSEIEVVRISEESLEGRQVTVVEAKFSSQEGRKYYAQRMICHIDKELQLPVGITCFDEKDVLVEDYGYKDVKINAGLTDQDFSKDNTTYKF